MGAVSTILARVFLAETEGLPRRVNIHLPLSPMSMVRFPLSHTKELSLMVDITGAASTILARVFLAETGGLPRRVNIHLPQSHMSMWRSLLSPMSMSMDMVDIMGAVSTILARVFLAETGGLPRRVNIHQSQSHMSM